MSEPAGSVDERVAAGAAYLDEKAPGWWEWFTAFDSAAGYTPAVLWSDFQPRHKLRKLTADRLARLGLAVDGYWEEGSAAEADYWALARAWRNLIQTRLTDRDAARRQAVEAKLAELRTWSETRFRDFAYWCDADLVMEFVAEERDYRGRDRQNSADPG